MFPKQVRDAFVKLGKDQRGEPESCMLDVQFMAGGGVLSPLVEHVGDITHRMTHLCAYTPEDQLPNLRDLGYDMVADKVFKTRKWLQSSYGFEREFEENTVSNFEYYQEQGKFKNQTVKDYKNKITVLLDKYADAHAKLTVYNECQWLAREAAIKVGRQQWFSATTALTKLWNIVKTEELYQLQASAFVLDSSGKIKPYKYN